MTIRFVVLLAGVFGLLMPERGAAQATGIPIRNAGVTQGISLGVDVGFGRISRTGDDDISKAVAGTLSLGFGPIGGSLLLSRVKIDPAGAAGISSTAVAATAELSIIGGPLVPLKVVWQAGYARPLDAGDNTPWRGSLGIGFALSIPATVVAIKPWLAPRFDYFGRQPVSGTRFKPSLSAGIDLGMLNGLGIRVGYDNRLGWTDATERASGISVGVRYQFR